MFADRFHSAALSGEWVSLLDDIARHIGAEEGRMAVCWPCPEDVRTSFAIQQAGHRHLEDDADAWASNIRESGLIDAGFQPNDRREASGARIGSVTELFTGDLVTLEFLWRGKVAFAPESLDFLNQIDPVWKSAALLSARLEFEKAKGAAHIFGQLGLPGAVALQDGQLLYTNELFEEAEPYIARSKAGYIELRGTDPLRRGLQQALKVTGSAGSTLFFTATEHRPAASLQIMPLLGEATSLFARSCRVIALSPVTTSRNVPSAENLSSLFGLTVAEAKLSLALASGMTLRDCAEVQKVTIGTARSYLNRIFSKTRTSQQSELVSLLKSVPK